MSMLVGSASCGPARGRNQFKALQHQLGTIAYCITKVWRQSLPIHEELTLETSKGEGMKLTKKRMNQRWPLLGTRSWFSAPWFLPTSVVIIRSVLLLTMRFSKQGPLAFFKSNFVPRVWMAPLQSFIHTMCHLQCPLRQGGFNRASYVLAEGCPPLVWIWPCNPRSKELKISLVDNVGVLATKNLSRRQQRQQRIFIQILDFCKSSWLVVACPVVFKTSWPSLAPMEKKESHSAYVP
jgi:hypothetical protein